MVGCRFGKWTVISYAGKNRWNHNIYLCKCECGASHKVQKAHLKGGKSTKCRSCGYPKAAVIGCIYGDLTVLKEVEPNSDGHRLFLCRSSCGKERIVRSTKLKSMKPI